MKFTLEIDCNNAAFKSEDGTTDNTATEAEVARLLGVAAAQITIGRDDAPMIDYNGNTVGRWAFVGSLASDKDSQAIIVEGNPIDGFSFTGPFEIWADAGIYSETQSIEGDWWIAELHPAATDV